MYSMYVVHMFQYKAIQKDQFKVTHIYSRHENKVHNLRVNFSFFQSATPFIKV